MRLNAVQSEQLAPFYVRRSLDNYPGGTPLQMFVTGMDALVRTLPAGSPAASLCFRRIARRASELARAGSQEEAAGGLVHLLAHLLLVVDLQVSPQAPVSASDWACRRRASIAWMAGGECSALQALDDGCKVLAQTLSEWPALLRADLVEDIGRIVASSDDYARKVLLVRWYQGLLHSD